MERVGLAVSSPGKNLCGKRWKASVVLGYYGYGYNGATRLRCEPMRLCRAGYFGGYPEGWRAREKRGLPSRGNESHKRF